MTSFPEEPVDRQEQVKVQEEGGSEHKVRYVRDRVAERSQTLYWVIQFIWLIFGGIEALIGLRVFLKLIAANPANPFAAFVYLVTDLLLRPFFGLTITPSAFGMVLEVHSLIAMVVYLFVGWGLVRLIWLLFYQPSSRMISTYDRNRMR
jgi:hypothetical protein